jgi:hypothetical protein
METYDSCDCNVRIITITKKKMMTMMTTTMVLKEGRCLKWFFCSKQEGRRKQRRSERRKEGRKETLASYGGGKETSPVSAALTVLSL